MTKARTLRSYLAELVVVFVGVALAFAVDNFREAHNDRAVGDQYLSAFRQDLTADLQMLQDQQKARQAQLRDARTLLEFFEGRPNDPAVFFEAYWPVLFELRTAPNRNTMDEVLSSGSLRLIRDAKIRTGLLSLYATYAEIAFFEEHMARDFDVYLYDPTFSSVPIQFKGPWNDTPANRQAVETLLGDRRIENGLRLIVLNLDFDHESLLPLLERAKSQVEQLLQQIPAR
ncbi:MAG: hypothetical protein MUO39_01000 [Steroidobacteraceae bacterium]|nr:hypothetical protein [Steroidobacteraceae bacterium]